MSPAILYWTLILYTIINFWFSFSSLNLGLLTFFFPYLDSKLLLKTSFVFFLCCISKIIIVCCSRHCLFCVVILFIESQSAAILYAAENAVQLIFYIYAAFVFFFFFWIQIRVISDILHSNLDDNHPIACITRPNISLITINSPSPILALPPFNVTLVPITQISSLDDDLRTTMLVTTITSKIKPTIIILNE